MSALQQFMELTGVDDTNVANFYLNSCKGDVNTAVSMFFDQSDSTQHPSMSSAPSSQHPSMSSAPSGHSSMSSAPPPSTSSTSKSTPSRRGNFATLSDFSESTQENDDEQDDDDRKQKWYTGGSSTSGQQVIANPNEDLTSKLFEKAKQAKPLEPIDSKPQSFSGHGQRLGTQASQGLSLPAQKSTSKSGVTEHKRVRITFYKEGFTVDDGELRLFSDPKNKEFLKAMDEGYVPAEVARGAKTVDVELVDRKSETYTPPPKRFEAFSGSGSTLKSSTTNSTGSSSVTPLKNYQHDPSKPHTTIQIRLPSGAVRQTFNLSDTIQTIKNFIAGTQTNLPSLNFSIMTTFPRKTLSDTSQTLEQAGLKNAAVVVNFE